MPFCHSVRDVVKWMRSDAGQTLLHLGSGSGSSALHLRREFLRAHISPFECDHRALEICPPSLSAARVDLIPLAVSSYRDPLLLYPSATNSLASSSLRPLERVAWQHPLQVACPRLDSWCRERGVSPDL